MSTREQTQNIQQVLASQEAFAEQWEQEAAAGVANRRSEIASINTTGEATTPMPFTPEYYSQRIPGR